MAANHKMTVSMQPTNRRPSTAERRAAQIASLSTRQAELKQEAAERRAARANRTLRPHPRRARWAPRDAATRGDGLIIVGSGQRSSRGPSLPRRAGISILGARRGHRRTRSRARRTAGPVHGGDPRRANLDPVVGRVASAGRPDRAHRGMAYVLRGIGVHVSPLDAIAPLIAMFTLGQLPIGPTLGPAAAVLILGSHGVATAAARQACY
jgi:hypothetical protein